MSCPYQAHFASWCNRCKACPECAQGHAAWCPDNPDYKKTDPPPAPKGRPPVPKGKKRR